MAETKTTLDETPPERPSGWTFLSNHAHVLVCLARDPDVRLRDVAEQVGITERAVFNIVTELEAAGVVHRSREGRRNHYDIEPSAGLRHPLESERTVGELLQLLAGPDVLEKFGLDVSAQKSPNNGNAAETEG